MTMCLRCLITIQLALFPSVVNAQFDFWQEAEIAKYFSGFVWDIDYGASGDIFAIIQASPFIVRSTDGGASWDTVGSNIVVPVGFPGSNYFSSDPAGPLYVTGASGIHRSTDNGAVWEVVWDGWEPTTVAVNTVGDVFFSYPAIITIGLLKSTDDGTTWFNIGSGLDRKPIWLIAPSLFTGSSEDIYIRMGTDYAPPDVMFRSTNSGETFTPIAVDPLFEISVSPLTGSVFGTGLGIFRSRNRGDSWEIVGGFGTPENFAFGQIMAGGNGYIYVARRSFGNDLWISPDDGATWSMTNLLGRVTAMDVHTDGSILVGTEDAGIYRSTDNGDSWTSLSDGLPGASNNVTTMAVSRLGIGFAQGAFGTYKSADQGLTWAKTVEDPFTTPVSKFLTHPNGDLYVLQGGLLLRSSDSGASWVELSWAGAQVAMEADGNILSYSASVIRRSTDLGSTWQSLRACNYPFEECLSSGPIDVASGIILAGWQYYDSRSGEYCYGYYLSVDNGSTWQSRSSQEVKSFKGSSTGRLFLATGTGLLSSDDFGTTWSPANGLGTTSTNSLVINGAHEIFAGTSASGVYRSTDDGETWEAFNSDLSELRINSLFIDEFGVLFAATPTGIFRSVQSTMPSNGVVDRGTISFGSGAFGSSSVDSFKVVNTGAYPLVVASVGASACFIVSPEIATIPVGDSLFVKVSFPRDSLGSFSESVLLNSNSRVPLNEVTFTGTTTGALVVTNLSVNFGSIKDSRKDSLVVIANAGHVDSLSITRVESSSSSFRFLHSGSAIFPGQDQVDTIAFIPTSLGLHLDTLVLFSNSISSPDTIVVYGVKVANDSEGEIPLQYYLGQNYPNPFNSSTSISFGIPFPGHVVLSVHSLLGESRILTEDDLPAGSFEYQWQPEGISSGLYLYRLSAGGFTETRKMLLLK